MNATTEPQSGLDIWSLLRSNLASANLLVHSVAVFIEMWRSLDFHCEMVEVIVASRMWDDEVLLMKIGGGFLCLPDGTSRSTDRCLTFQPRILRFLKLINEFILCACFLAWRERWLWCCWCIARWLDDFLMSYWMNSVIRNMQNQNHSLIFRDPLASWLTYETTSWHTRIVSLSLRWWQTFASGAEKTQQQRIRQQLTRRILWHVSQAP